MSTLTDRWINANLALGRAENKAALAGAFNDEDADEVAEIAAAARAALPALRAEVAAARVELINACCADTQNLLTLMRASSAGG